MGGRVGAFAYYQPSAYSAFSYVCNGEEIIYNPQIPLSQNNLSTLHFQLHPLAKLGFEINFPRHA